MRGDKVEKVEFLPSPQSPVPSPQSPIPSPQSPVPNPQSPIPNLSCRCLKYLANMRHN
ncbi:hypothetical protein [Nostoc sp. PCC 7524]|uniref:hypothetical protein n=1 Tax=Nostoc sp. (strain ATCC 29411 / PCC 7524) TaxID=28072 RepID=UPI000A82F1DA|nr:hypothetical protein [Nostoc sp. PCC 7524]